MLYWKAIGVLPLSLLLMGSKLVITVPPGGSVESSSGLIACSAGEVCTVEVDGQHLEESFRAIPYQGNHFAAWEDSRNAICAGSRNPECSDLDSGEFSGYSSTAAQLNSDAVMTMRPTFISYEATQPESAIRFAINSRHRTRYYEIKGDTSDELWQQLSSDANPLRLVAAVGRKPLGEANLTYNYSYQPGYATNSGNCQVASAEIKFNFETILPRLANLEEKPDHLRNQWLEFQSIIIGHEADHQKIYRRLVKQLPEALASVNDVPCNKLDAQVNLAVSRAVNNMKQASAAYDALGGHEGTVNPFLQRVGMRN